MNLSKLLSAIAGIILLATTAFGTLDGASPREGHIAAEDVPSYPIPPLA